MCSELGVILETVHSVYNRNIVKSGWGWVGGNIKWTGVLVGNFEKNPKERYQDPVLWAWLEISHKRCQF